MKATKLAWHPAKAALNLAKHGVSLEEAASVLDDPQALYESDLEHGECRELVLGMSADGHIL